MLVILFLMGFQSGDVLRAAASLDMQGARSAIEKGEGINATNRGGETPLMLAAKTGYLDMVRLLLDNGAQTEATNFKGETALFYAVRMGRVEAVKALIGAGSPLNTQGGTGATPLFLALARGDYTVTRLLVEGGADVTAVNGGGETPLLKAVLYSDLAAMTVLVGAGADVGKRGKARFSPLKTARFLENSRADAILNGTANRDLPPIEKALAAGDLAALQSLGAQNPEWRNKQGDPALLLAAKFGHVDLVEYLLAQKHPVNAVGADGRTALMTAVHHGRISVVSRLVQAGADANRVTDRGGATALSAAYANQDIVAVNFVVRAGGTAITRKETGEMVSLAVARARVDLIKQEYDQYKPRFPSLPFEVSGVPELSVKPLSPDASGISPVSAGSIVDGSYPEKIQRRMPNVGMVRVRALVSRDGQVREIQVSEPAHLGAFGFEYGAVKAFKRWRLQPARKDGAPVTAWGEFEVSVFRD